LRIDGGVQRVLTNTKDQAEIADTKERFGFERLITDGASEFIVMALSSLDSLSSAPYPVKTKDEEKFVVELVSKFTIDGGKWDVHGITNHWNMVHELIQIGKESPRNITPKHHSHIAQHLKSIEDKFIRYATTSVLRDDVKDLQKSLSKPVYATPKVMPVSKRSDSLAFDDTGNCLTILIPQFIGILLPLLNLSGMLRELKRLRLTLREHAKYFGIC